MLPEELLERGLARYSSFITADILAFSKNVANQQELPNVQIETDLCLRAV